MKTKRVAIWMMLAALAWSGASWAARGDDKERKSKNGKVEGSAGGAKVALEYGRPNVSGRKIFGALVPYGQTWRAGADEATTISFDKNVTIEGQALPAGRYALFMIPTASSWTIVFNTVADQWGAFKHDPASDALRVTVQPSAHDSVESLEYVVSGDRVEMHWDTVSVGFAVKAAS